MRIRDVLIFAAGAAVGAGVTWLYNKKRGSEWDDIPAEPEVKATTDVEERFGARVEAAKAKRDEARAIKPDIIEYAAELAKNRQEKDKEDRMGNQKDGTLYFIALEQLDECEDYYKCELTYTADNILIDEVGDPVNNFNWCMDLNYKARLRDADACYIRDDELETDYEIVRDWRTFKEITGKNLEDTDYIPDEDEFIDEA